MFCLQCGKEIPDHSLFCLACGKPLQSPQAEPIPATRRRRILKFVLILFGVVVIVVILTRMRTTDPSADFGKRLASTVAAPLMTERSQTITSGSIVVKAGRVQYFRFVVDTDKMRDVRVVGRFHASGGWGNDIQAILASETDFQNWVNGHPSRALYNSGKTTAGEINRPILSSGTYVFAVSNIFALLSPKTVTADVELKYLGLY